MRQKPRSFRLHHSSHRPGTWALLAIAGLFALGGLALSSVNTEGKSVEEALALEEDRDAFWKEVQGSDGDWVASAGQPVWENIFLATVPQVYPAVKELTTNVLGHHIAENGGEKYVDIDLSDKKLRAWEGDHLSFEFDISSGRPGYETVQGEFYVWNKVKYKSYRGGSRRRGDYYFLPNVPFSLFFYKGYAIHGAYWHVKFGEENISHGCINLRPEDAELLWYWAPPLPPEGQNAVRPTADNPGLRVVIHE